MTTETRTDFADLTICGYPDLQPVPNGTPSARQASARVHGTGKLTAGRREALLHLLIGQHPKTGKWALDLRWYGSKVRYTVEGYDARDAALAELPTALEDVLAAIEQVTHQEHLPAMPKPVPSKATRVEWDGGKMDGTTYANGTSWDTWCRDHGFTPNFLFSQPSLERPA